MAGNSTTNENQSTVKEDYIMDSVLSDLRLIEKDIENTIECVVWELQSTEKQPESMHEIAGALMKEHVPKALDRICSNIMKANDYMSVRFDEIESILDSLNGKCSVLEKIPQLEKCLYLAEENASRTSPNCAIDGDLGARYKKMSTIDLDCKDFSTMETKQMFERVSKVDLSFPSYYQSLKNVGIPIEFDETELSICTTNKEGRLSYVASSVQTPSILDSVTPRSLKSSMSGTSSSSSRSSSSKSSSQHSEYVSPVSITLEIL